MSTMTARSNACEPSKRAPSLLKLRKPLPIMANPQTLRQDSNQRLWGQSEIDAEGKHSWEEVRSGGSYLSWE
jgi:hypothetical protein